ncbi:agrin [Trichonephila clavata]|uniref:Agrin n=1 Tax=Trichonephila clavata TaxID=2740835 RepID=A0A8X6FSY2_TRICU|nr:agrin [Trichonephila clavata]
MSIDYHTPTSLSFFSIDLCQNVHCKHGARCENGHCICAFDCPDAYDPVCGSDGTTYRNDCEMRRGSCQKGINLATVFFGECDRTPSGSWEGTSFYSSFSDPCLHFIAYSSLYSS